MKFSRGFLGLKMASNLVKCIKHSGPKCENALSVLKHAITLISRLPGLSSGPEGFDSEPQWSRDTGWVCISVKSWNPGPLWRTRDGTRQELGSDGANLGSYDLWYEDDGKLIPDQTANTESMCWVPQHFETGCVCVCLALHRNMGVKNAQRPPLKRFISSGGWPETDGPALINR